MHLKAHYKKYHLEFKQPAGTSRGVMHDKTTYFIILRQGNKTGIGECGLLRGLSYDDVPDYEEKLSRLTENIHLDPEILREELREYPSIQFGWEQALLSLQSEHPFILYPSDFTSGKSGIAINGLIWMNDIENMKEQVKDKLQKGFRVIKIKIGNLNFEDEWRLLSGIRALHPSGELELRVDANGAYTPEEAPYILDRLAQLDIHSIEQPIRAGQWDAMAHLCRNSPVPIALDEELIGILDSKRKKELLEAIQPDYIILKPSLTGGFAHTREWVDLAEKTGTGWWITSALESNIGLNAIAQFTYTLNTVIPQGLGTGSLFTNNIDSPLYIEGEKLYYGTTDYWNTNIILT